MSFGLSKKKHNLNQYTLLSNLEGKSYKFHEEVLWRSRATSIDSFKLTFVFFLLSDCVEQLKASTDTIKDDSLPLQNFCANFEQILLEGARSTSYVYLFLCYVDKGELLKRIKIL